jgi:hypothetical protein
MNDMTNAVKEIYLKHFDSLFHEIELFQNAEAIWKSTDGIVNSSGNLTLHLLGNLNHFVGAQLANTGYIRNREHEFSAKGIEKNTLLSDITKTKEMMHNAMDMLTDADLGKVYPLNKFGEGKPIGYVLLYLLAHFTYHLGQINYLRRILEA